jgi:hypothetical protein
VPFKRLRKLDSIYSARVAAKIASECNGIQETIPSAIIATALCKQPLAVSPWKPLLLGAATKLFLQCGSEDTKGRYAKTSLVQGQQDVWA